MSPRKRAEYRPEKLPENWTVVERARLHGGGFAAEGMGRIYVGDEFCERRLPGQEQWRNLKNPGITLLTGPATDHGVDRIQELLNQWFSADRGELEIVINDLGVLELSETFVGRGLKRILGRLLTTRYTRINTHSTLPDSFLDFAVERGVVACEFNSPVQLAESSARLRDRGLKAHLYWPHEYFTTTRYCPVAVDFGGSVRSAIEGCSRECDRKMGVLSNAEFPEFIVFGNTHFVRRPAPQGSALHIDRLIDNSIF